MLISRYVKDKDVTYYKYDLGYKTNHTDIWIMNNTRIDRCNDYSVMVETGGSNQVIAVSNISLTDFHVEIDILQVDGSANQIIFQILKSDYSWVDGGTGLVGEWKHFSFDKHNLEANSRIRLITTGDITQLKFKNFIISEI